MTFSKGKLVIGGIATYTLAVFAGYKYAQKSKPQEQLQNPGINESADPKNIVLQDSQRLSSFNQHAKTYDSGKYFE